jgi:hypothetical protein
VSSRRGVLYRGSGGRRAPGSGNLRGSNMNTLIRNVSRGAQNQIGTFFESGGATIVTPSPADRLFETPIALPLPEVYNYSAVQNPNP